MSLAWPLRVATAGGVGDGKSTLIARLLSDLSLVNGRAKAGSGESPRIEVVYRYFATGKRRFILADSPDHEHYAHNLASGAANADAMVVLVDVTKGLAAATRRQLEVARLLGIRQSVAFINKMDQVGYSQPALQRRLRIADLVHLVDEGDALPDAEQARNLELAPRRRGETLGDVHEHHHGIGVRRPARQVVGIVLVVRRVGEDEPALPGREIAVYDLDAGAFTGTSLGPPVDERKIAQQPCDQRALAVADAARRRDAQRPRQAHARW